MQANSSDDSRIVLSSDQRILRAFLAGEVAAIRQVERWAREIARFRWGLLSSHDSDDIVQETVSGVWRAASAPSFELSVSLRALVRRVATARCIDRLRRRRPITPLDPSLPDPRPSPYDDAVRSDERARLRRALQELDLHCRELLRAHFLEEETYTVIAARSERAESTIRWQVLECLKRVRKLWCLE